MTELTSHIIALFSWLLALFVWSSIEGRPAKVVKFLLGMTVGYYIYQVGKLL